MNIENSNIFNSIKNKREYNIVIILITILVCISFWKLFEFFKPTVYDNNLVSITSLEDMNKYAQGNEIALKKVVIDGKENDIVIKKGAWIEENNAYRWKMYDIPDNITNNIEIQIPYGVNRKLFFEKNIWRGKVEVKYSQMSKIVDCYSNSKKQSDYIMVELPANINNITNIIYYSIGILITIFLCLILLKYKIYICNNIYKIIYNIKIRSVVIIKNRYSKVKMNNTKYISMYLIFVAIVTIFVTCFIYREDPLYIWDYGNYQNKYSNLGNMLVSGNYKDFAKEFLLELRSYDYNSTSLIFILPFYYFYKSSRMGYIEAIAIIYCIPAIIIIYSIIVNIVVKKMHKESRRLICGITFFMCATFTYIWGPVMIGFTDIVGLIPLMLAYYIMLKNDMKDISVKQSLIIGLLLYCSFMFRRWYAFGVVAFYISTVLMIIYDFARKSIGIKKVCDLITKLFFSGIVIIISSLLLQYKLIFTILNTRYSNKYQAYQLNSLNDHLKLFVDYFGIISISIMIMGIIVGILQKKYRRISLYMTSSLIISFLIFIRVQKFSWQHNYLLTIQFLIISSIFVGTVIEACKGKGKKYILSVVLIVLISINFMYTFCIKLEPNILATFTPNQKYLPIHKEAMGELNRLENTLRGLIENSPDSKWASFTTGWNLNDALIEIVGKTNEFKNAYISVSHIDETHKLKLEPFSAKYVVVTDEVVYQQQPSSQMVISIPNNEIYNGVGIGNAYKRISNKPFIFEGGTRAYIYEKQRDFTSEEVSDFLSEFYKYYPEWKDIYSVDKALNIMNNRNN